VNGRDIADTSDLRALAGRITSDDRAVKTFIVEAFATINSLRAELDSNRQQLSVLDNLTLVDIGPAARMEQLVLQLQREIDELNGILARVRALADFSEWAASAIESAEDPAVRTSDLRRAMAKDV